MKCDIVLRGGFLFDPENGVKKETDIGILDGKIAALDGPMSGAREWNLSGKTVLPGVIDMHVHVTQELGGPIGYYMAARSGVSTIIDYAGPMDDILEHAPKLGCGMNVGCLPAALPGFLGQDPSREEVEGFLEDSLSKGALGLKILGGHYPLTPDASRRIVEACNEKQVFVAWHAGSTENRSNIYGMKEAVECSEGFRLLMAHINAYCRGNCYSYLEELRDAFAMLRDHPNIIADSHMAVSNGTNGFCEGNEVQDHITQNCLRSFGYAADRQGLEKAIRDGVAGVIVQRGPENVIVFREEGLSCWQEAGTALYVSFPANLPVSAAACLLERRPGSREFLIDLAATDGGGFPRNGLLKRLLAYYKLGYLSLEEVVYKCSIAPARVFAMPGKGHLGVGADADLAAVDLSTEETVLSFAAGRPVLEEGEVTGNGASLLITPAGVTYAAKKKLSYQIVRPQDGWFYHAERGTGL